MIGFSDIDRKFRAPAKIVLECRNCGGTDRDVRLRWPRWLADAEVVLCYGCWDKIFPDAPDLVAEIDRIRNS